MRRLFSRRWLLVLAALSVLAACDKGSEHGVTQPDESAKSAQAVEPRPEGEACSRDGNCESYLRCIDEVCTVPPGVTGDHDDETPVVEIRGPDRRDSIASFHVEIADTPGERSRGLMFRRGLAEGWGMLFVHDSSRERSFWMENTFIPLDMIFIDAKGRVVSVVENAEPLTRIRRESKEPARYVLELNAGAAKEHGIEAGTTVHMIRIPDEYRPSASDGDEK